jgi:hypothetical protein
MDDVRVPHVYLRIEGTSGNPELEEEIALVFRRAFELWKEKQIKYGPNNIAQLGRPGILDRMFSDKYQRLKRFVYGQAPDEGEGELDAWIDCINYAAMGVMVYEGTWPGAASDSVTLPQIWLLIKKYIKGVLSND